MNYYYEISKTNSNNKFSKGIGFIAGLYEPSYVDEMRCSNATIGKEIKKIDKGYDYKYYFDENNRIILSEKYLSGKLSYINFYFYVNNYLEFIHYEVDSGIYSLSKSYYDENDRICRHIQIGIFEKYNISENIIYNEHLFKYEDNITYVTEITHYNPPQYLIGDRFRERTEITNMKIIDNILYYLDDNLNVKEFYPIRFKIVDGNKVNVKLPKRVPIFKIIKENIIKILDKWINIDKSVIWINCESSDLEMQYTTLKKDNEEKWNIAYYDANEEKIFNDLNHPQVLENLLLNNECNIDDLLNESDYFVNKMIKIIRELRKEGYITDDITVILSDLEIRDKTLEIAKKINNKETINGLLEEFDSYLQ
ncbi:MAG: hypothetical protein PHY42_06585 [Bacilli bacterium]|nr:hypothetical protein [Bacilli bacterium]